MAEPKIMIAEGYDYVINLTIRKGLQATKRTIEMGGSCVNLDALKTNAIENLEDMIETYKKENE